MPNGGQHESMNGGFSSFENDIFLSMMNSAGFSEPEFTVPVSAQENAPSYINQLPPLTEAEIDSMFADNQPVELSAADLDFLNDAGVQTESLSNELDVEEVKRLEAIDRAGQIAAAGYFVQLQTRHGLEMAALTEDELEEDGDRPKTRQQRVGAGAGSIMFKQVVGPLETRKKLDYQLAA